MRILQLVAEARPYDAVTEQARWIQRGLAELGHSGVIAAGAVAAPLLREVRLADAALRESWDLVLDHYSIATRYHDALEANGSRRWLVYHNITPAELLKRWAPAIAERCALGRERLTELLGGYEKALADSRFNAAEIEQLSRRKDGMRLQVEVLPICVEAPAVATEPMRASLAEVLSGRGPLLLFVGRIAPQKNHIGLFRLLQELRRRRFPGAELILAGDGRGFEQYEEFLCSQSRKMGLEGAVHFLGKVPESDLWTLYRKADVLCCVSRHEGFCVPVVEAFLAGLPVVATADGAVGETAGDAALLAPPGDVESAGEQCAQLLERPELRPFLAARGHERAGEFSYEALRARLERALNGVAPVSSSPPISNVVA